MTDIPALIARVRELDTDSHAWQGPWVAHTFEIDCPCPNGEHCGDPHTCEEVEAPEEYPDGQCVVQISVPGLETFARPTAVLIAEYRTAAPALATALEAAMAENERLREGLAGLADADCEYGDNCPTFGTRHGRCTGCKARAVLEGKP